MDRKPDPDTDAAIAAEHAAREHAAVEPVFSAGEIAARIAELGRRLTAELPDDALLVSLLGGSVIFLADLVRAIDRPLRYELLHVEASGEGDEESVLALHYPMPFSVAGQSVLLLKDVVSTGVVESYLLSQLRSHGAREVRLAALVDIPVERKTEIEADYHAFQTERHGVLVGYGLKHAGGHGNLPFIGQLPAAQ
jgi:hypoxanthine phosphoribosyltransferase